MSIALRLIFSVCWGVIWAVICMVAFRDKVPRGIYWFVLLAGAVCGGAAISCIG